MTNETDGARRLPWIAPIRRISRIFAILALIAAGACAVREPAAPVPTAAAPGAPATASLSPAAETSACPPHIRELAARSHSSLCEAFAALGVSAEGVAEQYPELTKTAVQPDGRIERWKAWSALFEVTRVGAGSPHEERALMTRFAGWVSQIPADDLGLVAQAPWTLRWLHWDRKRALDLFGDRGISDGYETYLESLAGLFIESPELAREEGFRQLVRIARHIGRDRWQQLQTNGDLETTLRIASRLVTVVPDGEIPALLASLTGIAGSPHPLAVDILETVLSGSADSACLPRTTPPTARVRALADVVRACGEESCWALDVLDADPGLLGLAVLHADGVSALGACPNVGDLLRLCQLKRHRISLLGAVRHARSEREQRAACSLWRAVDRSASDQNLADCLQKLVERHGATGLLTLAGEWHKVDASGAPALMVVTGPAAVCGRVLARGGEPEGDPGVGEFIPGADAVRFAALLASGQSVSVFETAMAGIDVASLVLAAVTLGSGSAPVKGAEAALSGALKKLVPRETLEQLGRGAGREALGGLAQDGKREFLRTLRKQLGTLNGRTRRDVTRLLKQHLAEQRRQSPGLLARASTSGRDRVATRLARVRAQCAGPSPKAPVACGIGRTVWAYGADGVEDVTLGTVLMFHLPLLTAEDGGY